MPRPPCTLRTLNEVADLHPDLRSLMKRHNVGRFVESGLLICSLPKRGPASEVLGYFLVDRCAIAKSLRQPIVQDFLVIYGDGSRPNYFSGRAADGVRSIDEFCESFGGGPDDDYGCRKTGTAWWCENHRYEIDDRDLPAEPALRAAIKAAIGVARRDVASDAWRRLQQSICEAL